MIQIRTNGEALDLQSGFSIEIEDSSPIFNDRGSQSIPVTVPLTRRNIRLLDAPHRLDAGVDPNNPERTAEVIEGAYIRRGTMNIVEAGIENGVTFNIGFDNSTAYAKWAQKKLSELDNLPVYEPDLSQQGNGPVEMLLEHLYHIYRFADPEKDDFAIFPLAINNESTGSGDNVKTYWEILNLTGDHGFSQPTTVKRLIDGVLTDVTIPEGYMVSPFLRVWRVLELIFEDIGIRVEENPFARDPDLMLLVVLNNTADCACGGVIRYSDLMPDATVEEFLNALWVRFGLVYEINTDTATVRLRLLKDIINRRDFQALDGYISGPVKVSYPGAQYVKLSAQTSIEGAAPSHERFEDFIRGLDVAQVRLGSAEPREEEGALLARQFVTGKWYRLDSINSKERLTSSSFFNWDPQTEGLTPLELSSDDEFVPIEHISTRNLGVGHSFNNICPLYLFGTRHFHSYIKGSDDTEASGDDTPLAFLFAYTTGGKTIGRLNPEGEDGNPIVLDDGTHPTLSLLFQFKDGLFAKFWSDYDEMLRHGNRSVEVSARINKLDLPSINIIEPCTIKGIRVLIDKITYSLPSDREVAADLTLRTIQSQGYYDIHQEQGIPDFSAATRHLEWYLYSETYGDELDSYSARFEAAVKFAADNDYQPHQDGDSYWYVDAKGAILKSMARQAPTWESDPKLTKPNINGQQIRRKYNALLTYDIYEVLDMSIPGADDEDWELSETPLGQISIVVEYDVVLSSRWVAD